MNCIKCYQEIPEGSKFCPYCGAEQTAAPEAGTADTQADSVAQPEHGTQDYLYGQPEPSVQPEAAQTGAAQAETKAQPESGAQDNLYGQPETNTQYQEAQNYNAGYQEASGYGSGYQNEAQQNNYQNNYQNNAQQNNYQNSYQNNYQNNYQNGYQNGNYQTPYQQEQGESVNWVPYLVLSIISTLCCYIPGIVAIVFSAQINSAVTSGNTEEARRAAKNAKIWIIVAFVLGILASIVTFAFGIIGESTYYYYY